MLYGRSVIQYCLYARERLINPLISMIKLWCIMGTTDRLNYPPPTMNDLYHCFATETALQ